MARCFLLCILLLLCRLAVLASDEPRSLATALDVSEMRFDPRDTRHGENWHGLLTLRIRIDGPEVEDATAWRELRITEAVDDIGTTLLPSPMTLQAVLDAEGWDAFEDQISSRPRQAILTFDLLPASRRATRISRVKGEVVLKAGGVRQIIRIPRLKSSLGKNVADPMLAAAGGALVVRSEQPDADDKSIIVELSGKSLALRRLDVLDNTKSVASQFVSVGTSEPWCHVYVDRPVDDKMTLEAELLIDQGRVRVPFEMKNVALP